MSVTIPNSVTFIGSEAFRDCVSLTGITIPNSVTGIMQQAFSGCTGIASVTFQGIITSANLHSTAFSGLGDLRGKYLAGGIGTYTTTAPVSQSSVWRKQ